MLKILVGGEILPVLLEENAAARALCRLLAEGPLEIPAVNYGGFEKVAQLPQSLPREDSEMEAQPGDVLLYRGDQMVLFYGANDWAYTRLGRIQPEQSIRLSKILGGPERRITLIWEQEPDAGQQEP